jgi:acyl-CoA reductase-like NAD-dependent aldehyde dehydrogenase
LQIFWPAHSEEIGRIETRDTGKMFKETAWQATYIAEYLHFFAGAADKISGDTLPIDKPDMFVFTDREPLGVIAAVIPWNSQMFLTATKLGPAFSCGQYDRTEGIRTRQCAPVGFWKIDC